MVNEIILKIQSVPNLLLGFIVLCLVLLALYYNNPPTTVCDIQMEEVNERLQDGFFKDNSRGTRYESLVMVVFNNCLESNSPGGCYDIFKRLDYLEGLVKTIPTECGNHESTAQIKGFLEKGLRLLVKIAWGEKPPVNKYNKTAWLDTADLGLFCRLKRQHQRLYGRKAWDGFWIPFVQTLPGTDELEPRKIKELALFSYPCMGLY